jgi:hypothetical protein
MTLGSLRPLRLPPPAAPGRLPDALSRRPLQLPRLPAMPAAGVSWGFTTVDASGRLAAADLVQSLGGEPGTWLGVTQHSGLLVLAEAEDGRLLVSGRWHVSLPTGVRRWHGLDAGTRVLLVADHDGCRLVAYPPAALNEMIMRMHAAAFGGDAR